MLYDTLVGMTAFTCDTSVQLLVTSYSSPFAAEEAEIPEYALDQTSVRVHLESSES